QHSLNQSWRFRQQGVPIERCQTGGQMRSRRVACNMNAGVGVVLMVVLADPSNCRNQLVKHWEQSSAMNAHIVEVQANIIQSVFNQPRSGKEVIACAA